MHVSVWAVALTVATASQDLDENLLQASRLRQSAVVRSLVVAEIVLSFSFLK